MTAFVIFTFELLAIGVLLGGARRYRTFLDGAKRGQTQPAQPKPPRYLVDCERNPQTPAECQWRTCGRLWLKWRKARPLLYASQCDYARALVINMLEACEAMVVEGVILPDRLIEALNWQLTRRPPPHQPPGFAFDPTSVGSPFFLHSKHHPSYKADANMQQA